MDKIAEIKERLEGSVLVIAKFGADGEKTVAHQSIGDIRYLLAELDRKDGIILKWNQLHKSAVDKQLQAENQAMELQGEIQKLREERDTWIRVARRVEEKKQSAQQDIERLKELNEKLFAKCRDYEMTIVQYEQHETRPEVQWFAGRMEKKLKENDHKKHWSKLSQDYLIERLFQEANELWRALKNGEPAENVINESADVSNISMMIADNVGVTE